MCRSYLDVFLTRFPGSCSTNVTDLQEHRAGRRVVKENDNFYGIQGLTRRRHDPWKNKSTWQDANAGVSQQNKKKNVIAGRRKELTVEFAKFLASAAQCHAPRQCTPAASHRV